MPCSCFEGQDFREMGENNHRGMKQRDRFLVLASCGKLIIGFLMISIVKSPEIENMFSFMAKWTVQICVAH